MKQRRVPFTALMLLILIGLGIYGRTHVGLLDQDLDRNFGLSTHHLLQGDLYRLVTSAFFTVGGWRFYVSLLMFALCVGWVEAAYGTRRAVITFFGVHLLSMLFVSLGVVLPLAWATVHHGELLYAARDVGPSAGYYGCLGFALAGMTTRHRGKIIAAVMAVLVVRFTWSAIQLPEQGRALSADLAHLVAFPLGLLSIRLVRRGTVGNDVRATSETPHDNS